MIQEGEKLKALRLDLTISRRTSDDKRFKRNLKEIYSIVKTIKVRKFDDNCMRKIYAFFLIQELKRRIRKIIKNS